MVILLRRMMAARTHSDSPVFLMKCWKSYNTAWCNWVIRYNFKISRRPPSRCTNSYNYLVSIKTLQWKITLDTARKKQHYINFVSN